MQRTLAGALGLLTVAGTSYASVFSTFTNDTHYDWRITYMPDFDQDRATGMGVIGLPNNGSMYCAPTATMNMAAYAARHGRPMQLPGPIYFPLNNGEYNVISLALQNLGALMGTHPDDGTDGAGWFNGADDWFLPSLFDVEVKFVSGAWAPTARRIFEYGHSGALTAFAYGRYEYGEIGPDLVLLEREGGHVVTPSRVLRNGTHQEIWYRNPGNSNYLFAQSDFVHEKHDVASRTVFWSLLYDPRVMTEILGDADDDLIRIIDNILIIRAGGGLTNPGGNGISLFTPLSLHFPGVANNLLTFKTSAAILDLDIDHLREVIIAVLVAAPGAEHPVVRIDTLTGEQDVIAMLGAEQLTISPDGLVYAIDGLEIVRINQYDPSETPLRVAFAPGLTPRAIACDDDADGVVVLCAEGVKVKFPWDIAGPPQNTPIPGPPAAGDVDLDVSPVDGSLWISATGDDSIRQFVVDPPSGGYLPGAIIQHPTIVDPRSVQLNNVGDVFFVSGGEIHHWTPVAGPRGGAGGPAWEPAPTSLFAGKPAGERLTMTRSRTNFDPDTMSGPGFQNVDPALEENLGENLDDCLADINFDRRIDFADLNLLLDNYNLVGGWLAGDADGDGDIDFADLNLVVSLFNTDCD